MIYFIQAGTDGPIKIGLFTGEVRDRLCALQTGCPVELSIKAIMDGDKVQEAALHIRFCVHAVRGEWFSPTAELLDFINQNAALYEEPARETTPTGQLIDTFGGTVRFAEFLGVGAAAVSNARKANRLPYRWHMPVFEEARRRGLLIAPELIGQKHIEAAE